MTAHQPDPGTARQAELDAARLLLGRMGLSPADLLACAGGHASDANLRRVHPAGARRRRRGHPPHVWLVLEPDPQPLGHPASRRNHRLGHPPVRRAHQDPPRGPAQHSGWPQRESFVGSQRSPVPSRQAPGSPAGTARQSAELPTCPAREPSTVHRPAGFRRTRRGRPAGYTCRRSACGR